jgi:hypothetical protein
MTNHLFLIHDYSKAIENINKPKQLPYEKIWSVEKSENDNM